MKMITLLFLCLLSGASSQIPNVTRAVGESVHIKCLLNAPVKSEKFLCLENDKTFTQIDKTRYTLSEGTHGDFIFLIESLDTSDAGVYHCGFRNIYASLQPAIRLAVSAPSTEPRNELNFESTGTMTAVYISIGVVAAILATFILLITITQRKMADTKSQDHDYINTLYVTNVTARPTNQENMYETLQADSHQHYHTLHINSAEGTNISATPRDQKDIYQILNVETLQHDVYQTLQII